MYATKERLFCGAGIRKQVACRRAYIADKPMPDPTSLKQAMQHIDSKDWGKSIDKFRGLDRQFVLGAWTLVPSSPSANPCRGIFAFVAKQWRRKRYQPFRPICRTWRPHAARHPLRPNPDFSTNTSHAAHCLRYAEAARRNEFVESYEVPGAYAQAPADPRFKARLHQPPRRRVDAPMAHSRSQGMTSSSSMPRRVCLMQAIGGRSIAKSSSESWDVRPCRQNHPHSSSSARTASPSPAS